MKRRSTTEIQKASDVPSYKHISDTECYPEGESRDCADILYNNIYNVYVGVDQTSVNSSNYHRDNYCVIPLNVTPMALKTESTYIPDSIYTEHIPSISSWKNFEYNHNMLVADKLALLKILGATFISEVILGMNFCECNNGPVHKDSSFIYPIDSLVTTITSISDEYANNWDTNWDMETIRTVGAHKSKESSSSEGEGPTGAATVYLCTIAAPSSGSGGVSIVTVNGSGGVDTVGVIAGVNFPSI